MKLFIPEEIFEEIQKEAKKYAPVEACGLLAGKGSFVLKFYPMTNADHSPEHFSMIPEEQFSAMKDIRKNGYELLSIWHSHPASPPRMSKEDIRLSFTKGVIYTILSLSIEKNAFKGFWVDDNKIKEVEIIVNKLKVNNTENLEGI